MTVALAPAPPAEVQRSFVWTRERYDQAVAAGVFTPDDKVELLEGQIVPVMSQNPPHSVATVLIAEALRSVFPTEAFVQSQAPIALSDRSEPEPDAAVIKGNPRDYRSDHPAPDSILLLAEVSDSALRADRVRKARVYAMAGIAEYWIVNLQDRTLEVHRDPAGEAYRTKTTLNPGDSATPLHAPDASIPVADLLP